MAGSPNRQEIKVPLVSGHVASHATASVQRPGSPTLCFRQTQVGCPILGLKGIDGRIGISIVHQNTQLTGHLLVKGLQIWFRIGVIKSLRIVRLIKVRLGTDMQGLLDFLQCQILQHDIITPTWIIMSYQGEIRLQSPPNAIFVGAIIVEMVLIESPCLFHDLVHGLLACRGGCFRAHGPTTGPKDTGHGLEWYLMMTGQEQGVEKGLLLLLSHQIGTNAGFRSHAGVTDRKALERNRLGLFLIVAQHETCQGRNVNTRVGFSRQKQFLLSVHGKGLVKGPECHKGVGGRQLIRPTEAIVANLIIAIGESHGGRCIKQEDASETRPRVGIVNGCGNPTLEIPIGQEGFIREEEGTQFGQ
mmetsp:Transcript_24730/g.57656  ORF Transcript_24730/g.57656 Transcript_24730/m.57656 type:complete len:359 (-) Transcript_24730:275-1351(-)